MAVDQASKLAQDYGTNTWLIQQLTEGITHPESLGQSGSALNCMNWVLGHIIHRRNTALGLLGDPGVWEEGVDAWYRSGSAAIEPGSPCRDFRDLQGDLEATEARLQDILEQATAEDLELIGETDRGEKPIGEHLAGLHWHETFHMGQLDMLRSLILARR